MRDAGVLHHAVNVEWQKIVVSNHTEPEQSNDFTD